MSKTKFSSVPRWVVIGLSFATLISVADTYASQRIPLRSVQLAFDQVNRDFQFEQSEQESGLLVGLHWSGGLERLLLHYRHQPRAMLDAVVESVFLDLRRAGLPDLAMTLGRHRDDALDVPGEVNFYVSGRVDPRDPHDKTQVHIGIGRRRDVATDHGEPANINLTDYHAGVMAELGSDRYDLRLASPGSTDYERQLFELSVRRDGNDVSEVHFNNVAQTRKLKGQHGRADDLHQLWGDQVYWHPRGEAKRANLESSTTRRVLRTFRHDLDRAAKLVHGLARLGLQRLTNVHR